MCFSILTSLAHGYQVNQKQLESVHCWSFAPNAESHHLHFLPPPTA